MVLIRMTSMLLALVVSAGLAAARCEPIEGLDPTLRQGAVLLLGEIHGTREAPAFVSTVACLAVTKGLAVSVGLELPREEEPRLLELIGSEGKPEDLSRFASSPFWTRRYQDGRTSVAMLELIRDLLSMRRSGGDIEVHFLDQPAAGRRRDEVMARRLLELHDDARGRFFVVLVGNLHASQAAGSGRMGALVAEGLGQGRITSLDMAHSGGSAWICQGSSSRDCAPARLRGRSTRPGVRIEMIDANGRGGYHGLYHLGEIEASPPARRP